MMIKFEKSVNEEELVEIEETEGMKCMFGTLEDVYQGGPRDRICRVQHQL